ncbi:mitochondrial genome maintenance MGM101 [Powellomyces hirtus]|nr:mitochondrial genome maintenance MGM101 [Powellomyces hirtus]
MFRLTVRLPAAGRQIAVRASALRALADLTSSHKGLAHEPFPEKVSDILLAPIEHKDIEVKPDGMLYLPEIKYRRILNKAFGPGGWGLIPRGPHTVNNKNLSREYALFCLGRFVAQARGEQDYFNEDGLPTASEGAKSNALMRCCKDLGIASELWDPVFIDEFKSQHAAHVMTVNNFNNTRKMLWRRKDRKFAYPIKEDTASSSYGKK